MPALRVGTPMEIYKERTCFGPCGGAAGAGAQKKPMKRYRKSKCVGTCGGAGGAGLHKTYEEL